MAVIAKLTLKMPLWRIRACVIAATVIDPFIWSDALGKRISSAMLAWIERGLVVKAD